MFCFSEKQKLILLVKTGQVKAAAIDVLKAEPFDLNTSPLRDAPNLVVTPHASWYSDQSQKVSWLLASFFCSFSSASSRNGRYRNEARVAWSSYKRRALCQLCQSGKYKMVKLILKNFEKSPNSSLKMAIVTRRQWWTFPCRPDSWQCQLWTICQVFNRDFTVFIKNFLIRKIFSSSWLLNRGVRKFFLMSKLSIFSMFSIPTACKP